MDSRTRILMIVSLVANLFLVGALAGVSIVGARLLGDRGGDNDRRDNRPGMYSAFQAIPAERRQALRRMMREPAIEAAPELRAARDARRQAAQLIAAPAYDAVAVGAAFKAARDHEALARAKVDAALATRLAQLSPEDRAAFGQIMLRGSRGPDGGRDRNGRDRAPGDGPPLESRDR